MRTRPGLCFAALCSAFVTWGASALADEQAAPGARVVVLNEGLRLPVAYVDRGLTYPAGILSPELDLDIGHFGINGGLPGAVVGGVPTVGFMGIGSGYSVTDDFNVHAVLFDLQFNKPAQLVLGELGATYRFIRGGFELGVGLDWVYQANGGAPGQTILPSLPMRVHLGHVARLDITPTLPISTAGVYVPGATSFFGGSSRFGLAAGGGDTSVGLAVPLDFSIQIIDQFHIGVGTGFSLTFNAKNVNGGLIDGDTFYIPLNFEVGVTIPGPHGPVLDMSPFFSLPTLFVPAIDQRTGLNAVQTGVWLAGVRFTTFFYL
jgi:hypothetical protein